ncbi:MAG: GIY-YIG nuclease family protein [Chloroflexi bacterium]|nr:GIY-YIG nuclease family protein [Chloroflexota bacterium]
MFHGYVLQSVADGHFYVGITNDLQRRLREHNKGRQRSTRARRPFRIVYSEGCASR